VTRFFLRDDRRGQSGFKADSFSAPRIRFGQRNKKLLSFDLDLSIWRRQPIAAICPSIASSCFADFVLRSFCVNEPLLLKDDSNLCSFPDFMTFSLKILSSAFIIHHRKSQDSFQLHLPPSHPRKRGHVPESASRFRKRHA